MFLLFLAFGVGEAAAKPIGARQQQDPAFGTVVGSATQGGTVVIDAITLPGSITAAAASGPGTATIDTFVSSPTSPATLPGNGRVNVLVGATLHVAAGNAPNQFRDGTCTAPSDVRW